MNKILSAILFTTYSSVALSNGGLVHIDKTKKCNFVVTNQSVPKGGEIRLRATQDGKPIGFISIGKYSDKVKGIRGGKTIPVNTITTNEVFKVPISEGGKYALFLTKDGMSCENNVKIKNMDSFDRIMLGNYSVDLKVYTPEF